VSEKNRLPVPLDQQIRSNLRVIADCVQRALDSVDGEPGDMISMEYLDKQLCFILSQASAAQTGLRRHWDDVTKKATAEFPPGVVWAEFTGFSSLKGILCPFCQALAIPGATSPGDRAHCSDCMKDFWCRRIDTPLGHVWQSWDRKPC
jgi:hypothetical protein